MKWRRVLHDVTVVPKSRPRSLRFSLVALLLTFGTLPLACTEETPLPKRPPGASGGTGGLGAAGAAGETGSGGDDGAPEIPCAVRRVIEAKCQRCHTDPPENGAPFALLTWDDTRAPYGRVPVYEAMLVAVESGFMPLTELELSPPVEDLTPAEKTTLLRWLEAGAVPDRSGTACNR